MNGCGLDCWPERLTLRLFFFWLSIDASCHVSSDDLIACRHSFLHGDMARRRETHRHRQPILCTVFTYRKPIDERVMSCDVYIRICAHLHVSHVMYTVHTHLYTSIRINNRHDLLSACLSLCMCGCGCGCGCFCNQAKMCLLPPHLLFGCPEVQRTCPPACPPHCLSVCLCVCVSVCLCTSHAHPFLAVLWK